MASKKLKQSLRRRKSFLPTLLVALLFWLIWGYVFFFVPPGRGVYFAFFPTLFLAVFLSAALLLANSIRGFLLASAVCGLLLLQFFKLGNLLTILLLIALLVVLDLRFARG